MTLRASKACLLALEGRFFAKRTERFVPFSEKMKGSIQAVPLQGLPSRGLAVTFAYLAPAVAITIRLLSPQRVASKAEAF